MNTADTTTSGSEDWDDLRENSPEFLETAYSLFEPQAFPNVEAALQHDYSKFGFSFPAFRAQARYFKPHIPSLTKLQLSLTLPPEAVYSLYRI